MSLWTSLSIGRQGLYVSQVGLQVTAQNIANVNTQGYKRQRVEQANLPYGLGVAVRSVDRMLDPFAEKHLLAVTSDSTRADMTSQAYSELENLFNEVSNRGLNAEFQDFFKALHDLSARPGGSAERATLRSRGESIGRVFAFLRQQMAQQMANQDTEVQNVVAEANSIIKNIADLNRQIGLSVNNDMAVNELGNDRDEWVRKLSELIPVTTRQDANGNFTVFIENSMPLVIAGETYQLQAVPETTNEMKNTVYWVTDEGVRQDITGQLTSGRLGGVLHTRDVIVPEQLAKLDRLAAEFVLGFNLQHRAGVGLDGTGGRNFFEALDPYAAAGRDNRGGVAITSALVANEDLLTAYDYEIRFTGPATYDVVNATTGATVTSGGAYVSGAAIAFAGLSVTLTTVSGAPQAGDLFRVSMATGAAANVGVSSDIENSLDAIAAGLSDASGDNQNALALANLETQRVAAGGTMSFTEMYHALLVELGVAAASESLEQDTQSTLLTQATNMVESVSGVNVDEEATNLVKYQRAFQAAAKIITVTDEMLQTMLNMI